MARTNPNVLSTRVNNAHLGRVRAAAAAKHQTLSTYMSAALLAASTGQDAAADDLIDQIITALGLPHDATKEQLQEALGAVYDQVHGPYESDPTAEAADPVPPPPGSPPPPAAKSALSAAQLAACKKIGMKPADFAFHLANALKRGGGVEPAAPRTPPVAVAQLTRAQIEGCKRLGITHEEFRARMAKVKTIR
jgi:hypothetical protein